MEGHGSHIEPRCYLRDGEEARHDVVVRGRERVDGDGAILPRRGGLSAERGMSAAERRSLSVSGLVKTKSRKILKDTGNYLKLIKRDIWVLT